ncbi:hypothetical protein KAJ27_05175 [bacterium]|nr:hypothetical protein [bacterium]
MNYQTLKDTYYIDNIWGYSFNCFNEKLDFSFTKSTFCKTRGTLLIRGKYGSIENKIPGTVLTYFNENELLSLALKTILNGQEFDIRELSTGEFYDNSRDTDIIFEYGNDSVKITSSFELPDFKEILLVGTFEYQKLLFEDIKKHVRLSGLNNI